MMRLFVFLAFALLVAEGAVEAYQSVGSHIRRSTDAPRNLNANDPDSAIRAANHVGRCVAEGRGTLARDLLAMPLESEEQDERAAHLLSGADRCMPAGLLLRTSNLPVLGGMADYYLLDVYRSDDIAAATAAEAAPPAPRNGLEHLGQCVARRDAAGVMELIETEPASDDETAAARALAPHLGQCVMAGETVRFTPALIRAVAAIGLYRLIAIGETAITEAAQ